MSLTALRRVLSGTNVQMKTHFVTTRLARLLACANFLLDLMRKPKNVQNVSLSGPSAFSVKVSYRAKVKSYRWLILQVQKSKIAKNKPSHKIIRHILQNKCSQNKIPTNRVFHKKRFWTIQEKMIFDLANIAICCKNPIF